jgi:membrane fusion protein, multidrug efflux system
MRRVPALLPALLLVLLIGCDEKNKPLPEPVRPVLSVVVTPRPAPTTSFAGTVAPRYSTDLGFRVMGRIVARDVNVGDAVTAGQRLAALDPVQFDLAVRSARADQASAEAQLATASSAEARQRALLADKATSEANFEAAQQARAAAAAAVTRAEANLAKAQEQRSYTELRVDYPGVVTATQAEVGQVVQPGQPVLTVARPEIREAVVDLPDDLAATLDSDSRFVVSLEPDPSQRVNAQPREIAPQADPTTRTRRVRLSLDNPPATFRLGTTVRAVLVDSGKPRIELPSTALLERDGRQFVWLVDPDKHIVSTQEIHVGARTDGNFIVTAGLAPGARVVVAGVHSLTQGQKVKLPGEPTP